MSEWAWVALGFGITYAGMGAYLYSLRHRAGAVRRHLGRLP